MGVGTLQKTNQRVAAAVKPAIKALWEWAPLQSNVHVDETPPVCDAGRFHSQILAALKFENGTSVYLARARIFALAHY